MKKSPCKDCEDRRDGCHSVCKAYKAWHEEVIAERKALRRDAEIDAFMLRLRK